MKKKQTQDRYALISVFNKTKLVPLARLLKKLNYQIISTGGTARLLKENNIPFIPVEQITGNPESFDGRMKTISFEIESGILFDRDKLTHIKDATKLKIPAIDIVICNLYPFEQTISRRGTSDQEAIEQIDVGGPTMVRAAAKNFKHVLVVVDPLDYELVQTKLKEKKDDLSFRKKLAAKAFGHTAFYDAQIRNYLTDDLLPEELTIPGRKLIDLRYGENPHQKGAVYLTPQNNSPLKNLTKHWGRELSLTNLTDINAGLESVRLFDTSSAVVIKHNSPCGIALGKTIDEALKLAIESDPESAFGGVVVLNRSIDTKTAKIIEQFKKDGRGNFDIIAGESVDKKTLNFLTSIRKSMGIYTFGKISKISQDNMQIKWVDGGFVYQTGDSKIENQFKNWKVVSKKKPSAKQISQMKVAWKFISRIKSNSIIVVDKNLPMTRGIGSGQTSRIRSTKIALDQAGKYASGAIMASDSFFPFDDSVQLAAEKGIGAIVQQGGSVNDQMSIDAANKAGIPMVFTNYRAFWH